MHFRIGNKAQWRHDENMAFSVLCDVWLNFRKLKLTVKNPNPMTVKVKFRLSTADPSMGTVYYQVIHSRVPRQISTPYRIMSDEWDAVRSTVTTTATSPRRQIILNIRDSIRCDIRRLNRIAARLECSSVGYTTVELVDEFKRYRSEFTMLGRIQSAIARQKREGRVTTADHYRSAFNSFRRFLAEAKPLGAMGTGDLMLDRLTSETMEQYEAWLKGTGVCPNTISFYIRIFRAVYRRAVEDEEIDDRHPFRRVYTGVDRTVKRALPLKVLRKVKALDLAGKPSLDFARDMFLLSFYLRGMSFVDMAFLRKSDLRDGYIIYRRRKTSQQLSIAWTAEMQAILDKYPANDTDYLLPIIRRRGVNERCAYRNAAYRLNCRLKQIGALVGAPDCQSWSFYRARHSWASAAHAEGIPVSVISEGMGHDSETTTHIYLASLDASVVDRANARVIGLL